MLKTIRNSFLIGVASVVIGYLLMVAVHAIPLNWTGQNYQNTVELLKREGMYPKETFSHRYLDNYADSVSMLLASYPGKESAWRKAANDYFLSYDGKEVYHTEVTPYDFLVGNYDPEKAHVGAATYARYWHGNLLLFKPLMCYFDYRQIRRVNSLLVLLATVAAIFLLFKRLPLTTPAFVVAILLLGPTALGKTIEFSCVVLVTLVASCVLLGFKSFSKPEFRGTPYLFLGAGIATAFVDFLTAPTLSLTIPLTILCQLRRKDPRLLRLVLECVFFWGCGYVGMMGGKWLVSLFADGEYFLSTLKEAISSRVSRYGYEWRLEAIKRCFRHVLAAPYLNPAALLVAIAFLAIAWRRRRDMTRETIQRNLVFLIPILIPFGWYFVLAGHSAQHDWFAYRSGVGTVFAGLAALDFGLISPDKLFGKMKELRKTALNIILILICSILGGYALLTAGYAVPLDWKGSSRDETITTFKNEGLYPYEVYSQVVLDNFTDSFILLMASYQGNEGPLRQAACNYSVSYGGDNFYNLKTYPLSWLTDGYNPETAIPARLSYGRYWHGYVIPIRILLKFFSYPQIRRINKTLLLLVISATLTLLNRRLPRTVLPFSLTLLFLAPTAIGKCIEYSGDVYTALIASSILLLCNDRLLKGDRIRYFYLAVGIVTPFVGFFTSPTLTLTIPLVLMCQMRYGERNLLKLVAECVVFWGIGYAGMWSGKWLVAAVFEGCDFIDSLLTAQRLRMSAAAGNRFVGLQRCFRRLADNQVLAVLTFGLILFKVVRLAIDRRNLSRDKFLHNLLYFIPIALVCAWYLFLPNHTFIHNFFTYRHACVVILSIFAFLDLTNEPSQAPKEPCD